MDSMNVDTDSFTALDITERDIIGETCFIDLPNVRNAYALNDSRSISKILDAIGLYNGFGIENMIVLTANSATQARIFFNTSSTAHMVLRSFPDKARATVCIYTAACESGCRNMFFTIYDFLTQAFSSDYDSSHISFVEH